MLQTTAHPSQTPACCSSPGAQVLLLDEITVDLDVLGRADLMDFLRQECAERGATIIYVRGRGGARQGGRG